MHAYIYQSKSNVNKHYINIDYMNLKIVNIKWNVLLKNRYI